MSVVGFSLGSLFYQVAIFEHGRARLVLQTKPCDVVKLANLAEDVLGSELGSVVISVPTFFTYTQCRKIEDACSSIGLHVLRVIKDTSAASLTHAYSCLGKKKNSAENENSVSFLLVYQEQHDLGVSVATVDGDVIHMKKKTGGHPWQDSHLMTKVVEHLGDDFKRRFNCDLNGNPEAQSKLRAAALDVTSQLSSEWYATVTIPELHQNIDYAAAITKAEIEDLNKKAFQQSMIEYVTECLKGDEGETLQVQELVLVEGFEEDALQALQQHVFSNCSPEIKYMREDAAAIGAALQAAILNGKLEWLLVDVTTFDLRVELRNGKAQVIVPRNLNYPARREFVCDPSCCILPLRLYEGNYITPTANEQITSLELPTLEESIAVLDIDMDGLIFLRAPVQH